ncbi:hypothetical protein Y032_0069g334 [Ancylostoma ceylanicum]|uniref:Uncharacterized protein n=1 Tax=Ancylostoma ceylanicum TaxID=53326 RepID=A0A016TZ87_9BILA|nr:hypothetical protein Y032_0069g334 [Ancylostoma ceylanicum]
MPVTPLWSREASGARAGFPSRTIDYEVFLRVNSPLLRRFHRERRGRVAFFSRPWMCGFGRLDNKWAVQRALFSPPSMPAVQFK